MVTVLLYVAVNHVRNTMIAPNIILNGSGKANVVEMAENMILVHILCALRAKWLINVVHQVELIKGSFVMRCVLESDFLDCQHDVHRAN